MELVDTPSSPSASSSRCRRSPSGHGRGTRGFGQRRQAGALLIGAAASSPSASADRRLARVARSSCGRVASRLRDAPLSRRVAAPGSARPVARLISRRLARLFAPTSRSTRCRNGGWYDFGYFLGIVVFGVGARRSPVVYRAAALAPCRARRCAACSGTARHDAARHPSAWRRRRALIDWRDPASLRRPRPPPASLVRLFGASSG